MLLKDISPPNKRKLTILLVVLLIGDLLFIGLHVLLKLGYLVDTRLDIDQEGGFAELFQYAKYLGIVILLAIKAIQYQQKIYLGWTVLFLYFLLDDSLSIHETGGKHLSDLFAFQPMLGMRAIDIGELIVSGFFGALFLGIIVFAYRSSDKLSRQASAILFMFVLALAFCGVFIDMLHSILSGMGVSLWLSGLFTLMEDGGEQLIASLITTFVFAIFLKYREISLPATPNKPIVKNTVSVS